MGGGRGDKKKVAAELKWSPSVTMLDLKRKKDCLGAFREKLLRGEGEGWRGGRGQETLPVRQRGTLQSKVKLTTCAKIFFRASQSAAERRRKLLARGEASLVVGLTLLLFLLFLLLV